MKIKDIKIIEKGKYYELFIVGVNNKSKLIAKIMNKEDTLILSFLICELIKNGIDEEKFKEFLVGFRDRFPFLQ